MEEIDHVVGSGRQQPKRRRGNASGAAAATPSPPPWSRAEVERLMAAAVHIIPSGSGVVVSTSGVVLTCAHAVAADEDPDEDEVDLGT